MKRAARFAPQIRQKEVVGICGNRSGKVTWEGGGKRKRKLKRLEKRGGAADYVVQLQDNNKVTVNDQRTIEL